jgi:hypothetical protein
MGEGKICEKILDLLNWVYDVLLCDASVAMPWRSASTTVPDHVARSLPRSLPEGARPYTRNFLLSSKAA